VNGPGDDNGIGGAVWIFDAYERRLVYCDMEPPAPSIFFPSPAEALKLIFVLLESHPY